MRDTSAPVPNSWELVVTKQSFDRWLSDTNVEVIVLGRCGLLAIVRPCFSELRALEEPRDHVERPAFNALTGMVGIAVFNEDDIGLPVV